jgi:hypothetical protein
MRINLSKNASRNSNFEAEKLFSKQRNYLFSDTLSFKGAHIGLLGPMGTFYVSRQVDRVSNRQVKIILLSEKNFVHQN